MLFHLDTPRSTVSTMFPLVICHEPPRIRSTNGQKQAFRILLTLLGKQLAKYCWTYRHYAGFVRVNVWYLAASGDKGAVLPHGAPKRDAALDYFVPAFFAAQ